MDAEAFPTHWSHLDSNRRMLQSLIDASSATPEEKEGLRFRLRKLLAFTESTAELAVAHFGEPQHHEAFCAWRDARPKLTGT